MDVMQNKIWADKFRNNEMVYVLDDFEDIAFRFVPGTKATTCFAKRPKEKEYAIGWETDLVMNARIGGQFITKELYDNY
jgi:hypothetical protein